MATLQDRLTDLATRIATEIKAVRTLLNGNAADLSALNTAAKANLVAAVNELYAIAQAAQTAANAAAVIDDTATDTTHAWSAHKIAVEIQAARDALVNGAGAALDTLQELATALGNDPNFATTITNALAKRVRVDAAQTFTAGEQLQARANIGAQDAAAIGNPDTDLVAIFNAGLI
jgi:hypothetical protein